MNTVTDKPLKEIPKATEGHFVCDCGEKQELLSYSDRNDEVVVECQACLGFIKFPKGTK